MKLFRRFRLLILLGGVALFGTYLAGTSIISMAESDRQPVEKKFYTNCAKPTLSLELDDPTKPQPKTTAVVLQGDFSACIGSQLLVTTYKEGNIYSYAVYDIVQNVSLIKLHFAKETLDGDFRQQFPEIQNARLTPKGPFAPATTSIAVEDVQVTFASVWNN